MASNFREAPESEPASKKSELSDPAYQREGLFDQDPELLKAISYFATKIRSCPTDPKYPEEEPEALIEKYLDAPKYP